MFPTGGSHNYFPLILLISVCAFASGSCIEAKRRRQDAGSSGLGIQGFGMVSSAMAMRHEVKGEILVALDGARKRLRTDLCGGGSRHCEMQHSRASAGT